ncbi:pre-mRNA-splicing factor cwf23-like [Curcuma longa]|uniref:pre-mRNA-splicing factor cwf23-like n=1 Tax=Curcuma longa TaxID=136217 RepID=UPI003D9ECC0A
MNCPTASEGMPASEGMRHRFREEDISHLASKGMPAADEIEKAYRNQSRIRHPDKRPDDPNATADFQRLKTSFEALKDEAARRVFDARLRARRERILRDSAFDAKRRKLATDLEERERAAEEEDAAGAAKQAKRWEKHVAARLQKELAEFQARKTKKPTAASNSTSKAFEQEKGGTALDKERMLKVSWETNLGDYTAVMLRELFERFGGVEDVVIRSKASKKRRSAIVVMSSKEAAVAATHCVWQSLKSSTCSSCSSCGS